MTETTTSPTAPTTGTSLQFTDRPTGRCRTGFLSDIDGTYQGNPYTITFTGTGCGRQWNFGQGLSPVGLKVNLLQRHRLQPVFTALGGYMFSTRPIPVTGAGSFNFTFKLGAGVELYRSPQRSQSLFGNRSIRAEYRYHHISNAFTSQFNPGIDNGLFQVTYAFGR